MTYCTDHDAEACGRCKDVIPPNEPAVYDSDDSAFHPDCYLRATEYDVCPPDEAWR